VYEAEFVYDGFGLFNVTLLEEDAAGSMLSQRVLPTAASWSEEYECFHETDVHDRFRGVSKVMIDSPDDTGAILRSDLSELAISYDPRILLAAFAVLMLTIESFIRRKIE